MNKRFRPFYIGTLAIAGAVLLGTSFVPKANADEWDKLTNITVNEPIIAGDKVLQPGTYVWKLLDSNSDRHVVQIFDKDQSHLEETIIAIPNYRLKPTGKTSFTFWETPNGVPKAVRAWFYPGDNFGQEFPYPKKLVAQLVASAAPVPAASQPEPALTQPAAAAPVAQPQPATVPETKPEVQPAPKPAATPEVQSTNAPAAAPVSPSLPHTASNSPLIALLGLASLGTAGLLGLATKRA